ncbi:Radial spoke head 1 [Sparganum proliferum]
MDGWGELIHEKYRFVGIWKNGKLLGKGKYIFDKLNCQQIGEYVLTPAAPEEKRPDDEGDNITISRWKGQSIEKITEDDVKPKLLTEADITLEKTNDDDEDNAEQQATEPDSRLADNTPNSTVPADIIDSQPDAVEPVEDETFGDVSKTSPVVSAREDDDEPAESQDVEETQRPQYSLSFLCRCKATQTTIPEDSLPRFRTDGSIALSQFRGGGKDEGDGSSDLNKALTIDTLSDLLRQTYDENDDQPTAQDLIELKGHCLKTFSTFRGTINEQIKGTTMGLPISVLIAEAVLQKLSRRLYEEYKP